MKTPYDGKASLLASAYQSGYKAREEKKSFGSCPYNNYPSPRIREAWREGWRAANEDIQKRIPRIETQGPSYETRDA